MKFVQFYKNKWNLVILLLSIVSLIPCFFFVENAKKINDLQDITNANDNLIKETFSQGLDNIKVLLPFVFGMIIWISNSSIAAYAVSKKKTRSVYSYATVFLGGLGIHLIISLIYLIPFKKPGKSKVSKRIFLTTGATLGVFSISAPLAYFMTRGSFEKPVIGKKISMSFNKANPNLVEIFSDGLDMHDNSEMFLENVEYKDFSYIKHFMTPGYPTHLSMPMIYGDFKDNNPFKLLQKYGIGFNEYVGKAYSDALLNAGIDHFKVDETSFSSKNIVNPTNFSNQTVYGANVAGVPSAIKEKDSEINVTNWSGARDSNVGEWGISLKSGDSNSYDWLAKNMVPSSEQKGARILIQDLITHRPFVNSVDDKFNLMDFNGRDQKIVLNNKLTEIIEALKNIKNPNPKTGEAADAYENTMIVIYGDHASHDFLPHFNTMEEHDARKTESALFIKYPSQTANQNKASVIEDRYVWGPQLNEIIKNYFDNTSQQNPLDFIKTDAKFNNVPRPIFGKPTEYVWVKWQADEVKPELDQNGVVKKVIWDPVKAATQISELEGVDY